MKTRTEVFLFLIVSHVLADVFLRLDTAIESSMGFLTEPVALAAHTGWHGLLAAAALSLTGRFNLWGPALVLLSHMLIDSLDLDGGLKLIDQALHFSILGIVSLYSLGPHASQDQHPIGKLAPGEPVDIANLNRNGVVQNKNASSQ